MAYKVQVELSREPYVAQYGQVHYDGRTLTTRYLFQLLEELRHHGIDASRTEVEHELVD